MNLLLLLSALLSALTGVGASVRASERPQAVAEISIGRAAAVLAPANMTSRPVGALPTLAAISSVGFAAPVFLPATPLWTDRRRE